MYCDIRRATRTRLTGISRWVMGIAGLLATAGWVSAAPALVPVGDAGNAADATGYGAVGYAYQIGAGEVTRGDYAAFLNAVAATDTHGLYNANMGITRSGSAGGYVYSATSGTLPVAYVSWYDALRFANWLHNGQPVGAQGPATTEDGAYTFSGDTNVGPRNAGAKVFLPSEDEWYKAAYYKGGTGAGYWAFPTRSDVAPVAGVPPGGANSANYDKAASGVTAVGAYTGTQGAYGTRDQAGNLWEWNEADVDGDRGLRGGSYDDYWVLLQSSYRDSEPPSQESQFVGFRIAATGTIAPPPPVNHAPVAVGESYTVNAGATLTVAAPGVLGNDTDADGDALTAVRVTAPAHGTLVLNPNGSFTYTPAAGYSGAESFTYKPNDGTVDGNTVTVSITVNPVVVNRAPVAVGDSYTVNAGATLTVAAPGVLGNDTDADGNALTAVRVTAPAHGTLVLNPNGSFTYAPAAGYSGADSFTYKPNDGKVDGNTVTVSITVSPVAKLYLLTVGHGSGDGSYKAGTVVTIRADAAPVGQVFDRWTGNVATLASVTSATTTLTMPAGATTVTATYRLLPAAPFDMTSAVWTSSLRELRVQGKGPVNQTVVISDTRGHTLGSCVIRADSTWDFRVRLSLWRSVPTRVRATCRGVTDEMAVQGAGSTSDDDD